MQVLFIGMKANCVNSTQHLINNYMKKMGTKRTSNKQKDQTIDNKSRMKKLVKRENAKGLFDKHNVF
jgi:hypothetical protein